MMRQRSTPEGLRIRIPYRRSRHGGRVARLLGINIDTVGLSQLTRPAHGPRFVTFHLSRLAVLAAGPGLFVRALRMVGLWRGAI